MMQQLCTWLTGTTSGMVVTLLACLMLGYAIGKVKFGPITLGATVGTLLTAVIISAVVGTQSVYSLPDVYRQFFFFLFIFALGYDVGPSFVKSLRSNGVRLIILAAAFTVITLAVGIACRFVFGLGSGEMIGLFAGSATQSSVLGAAQAMMPSLGITGEVAETMNAQMTAAFAIGFLISYAGCVVFIKTVMPRAVGCKGLPGLQDAVKQEIEKNGAPPAENTGLFNHIRMRTYRIAADSYLAGMTVDGFQQQFQNWVLIETLMRGEPGSTPVEFDGSTVLQGGDVIAVIGDLEEMGALSGTGAEEVTDAVYQKVYIVKQRVVVTRTMTAEDMSGVFASHVIVSDVTREGKTIPDVSDGLQRGDRATLIGSRKFVERTIKKIGYPVDNSDDTNVIFMSFGMLLGVLVGLLSITLAGVPVGLGTSGGLILLGILCGWYNDKHPNRGHISPGARWFMKSVGLNLYVGCLGLASGATFISSLKEMGILMILSILLMSFLPHLLTAYFGKFVLKLSPVEILGGICGAGTNTAAMNALNDETGSSVFAASYTPAYAMANITLTFLGVISLVLFH